jgi:hypothetical protein
MKIDLEKEILSEDNKRQLALLEEAKKILEHDKHDSVSKIFASARQMSETVLFDSKIFEVFGSDVVSETHIKKIAYKYHLKFLPVYAGYKGSVGPNTGSKITEFEKKFELAFNTNPTKTDYFILAPAASFNLQEKPKDPLLFYKAAKDLYILIDKWGNDLSVTRLFTGWFFNHGVALLAPILFLLTSLFIDIDYISVNRDMRVLVYTLLFITSIVTLLTRYVINDGKGKLLDLNSKWDSTYR